MTIASGDLSIAICQRCNFQYPYKELSEDPNIKGLRVCQDCKDDYDPWRLPPPQPDPLQLRWSRPDVSLSNIPNTYDTYNLATLPPADLFAPDWTVNIWLYAGQVIQAYSDGYQWLNVLTDELIVIPSFYLDSVAGNDNNPGTLALPWASFNNIQGIQPQRTVFWKYGSSFLTPLTLGGSGCVFDAYGTPADGLPTINGLHDILGVPGDWTEVGTNGTTPTPGSQRWLKTIADGGCDRLFIVVNGSTPLLPNGDPSWNQSSPANVNSAGKYRWQHLTSTFRIWMFSTLNPASGGFSSLQSSNLSRSPGIDSAGHQVTVRKVYSVGWYYLSLLAGGSQELPTTIQDYKAQYGPAKGIATNTGGYFLIERPTLWDIGYTNAGASGAGDEGIDIGGLGGTDQYLYMEVIDPWIDNVKEDGITMRNVSRSSRCVLRATDPANYSGKIVVYVLAENDIDWKSGNFEAYGIFFEAVQVAPITAQINAKEIIVSNCMVNSIVSNNPYLSIAETDDYLISDHTGYYCEGSAGLNIRYTGQESRSTYDMHVMNFSSSGNTVTIQSGEFLPIYCTCLTLNLTGTTRAIYFNNSTNAANVLAIERVSGPENGFYTYRYRCSNVQNFFGALSQWDQSGLTGASAALNMRVTITETSPTPSSGTQPLHYAYFLVAASLNPPATVDITGLILTGVPFMSGSANGNAYIGTQQCFYAPLVSTLEETAYGANYFAGTGATEAAVRRSNRNYTSAQIESNVLVNQNLKNDTGGRMGGISNLDLVQNQADYTAAITKYWAEISVVSISITAALATVVTATPHGWASDRKVCTYGATPATCNGWHYIKVTGANSFTYPVARLTPNQVATGTVFCLDGSLAAGSSGLGTGPVISTGYTTNFQGEALLSSPNFGAV